MFLPARDAFQPEMRRSFRQSRRPEERVRVLGGAMDLVRPEEVFHFVAGKIMPYVSERFPLAKAGDAIAHLASRKAMGKVVVVND